MAATPILSVGELTTSFRAGAGWQPIVRNLSFEVAAGETLAIVGESGSGKSVTALSIMRLLPAKTIRIEGVVAFEGRDLIALSEAEMRGVRGNDISMIFQEPMTSLNPVLSIGYQIGEVLRLHRGLSRADAKRETVRLLERVRIPSARSRYGDYPHHFSGGMRQRVAIAAALACKPKLLIADEPTTALDVTIQAQILDLIQELQAEENMAVLFITHDMGVVAEIADRTLVMLKGDIVEAGGTREIFANPVHSYSRALLAAVPKLGAMTGRPLPMRFPAIDMVTGLAPPLEDTPDTVLAAARPIFEVRNLTTRFDLRSGVFHRLRGRVHAVENVSFSIQPGETLALVGESGCGKSTIARSILRLVEPTGGEIVVDGIDISTLDAAALRRGAPAYAARLPRPFRQPQPAHEGGRGLGGAHRHQPSGESEGCGRAGGGPPAAGRARAGHGGPLSPRVLGRPAPADLHRPHARAGA